MTTDELLEKLPSHIGRNPMYDSKGKIVAYTGDNLPGDIGWLYLHNDGRHWMASYGIEEDIVCSKSESENYGSAVVYGTTPNEALQKLYDWCVKNGFIL